MIAEKSTAEPAVFAVINEGTNFFCIAFLSAKLFVFIRLKFLLAIN